MNVTGITASATAMTQAQTAAAVQMSVLKKALELEGQSALQLVQAATQTGAGNPPNLGNRIDTYA
jgi:hypothetical protein